jgi:hypothetical protein
MLLRQTSRVGLAVALDAAAWQGVCSYQSIAYLPGFGKLPLGG